MNLYQYLDLNLNLNHPFPILVYLLTALIVSHIPYIRVYFSLCNTLLREVIRALLARGLSYRIKLNNDEANRITNSDHSLFKHTLITYAGYTGESLTAIGLFYLVSMQNYEYILFLFIGLIGMAILLWIRNVWGSSGHCHL
ncbi:M50 family metallopeptidase [uncultured Metabacillus sp.]|uniref:M50 family metallopeptidase n=1 Tax=uncultured Metabacillus sp. TaxID=2860135 RepID=UPI00263484E8|nr:M50 family metallopeptidase [uncultured Metabacillus sp.]